MQGRACSRRAWPAPPGQSQLLLVHVDRMQVGAIECRFIRNYLWFEGGRWSQLIPVEKAAECRSERYSMQIATPTREESVAQKQSPNIIRIPLADKWANAKKFPRRTVGHPSRPHKAKCVQGQMGRAIAQIRHGVRPPTFIIAHFWHRA